MLLTLSTAMYGMNNTHKKIETVILYQTNEIAQLTQDSPISFTPTQEVIRLESGNGDFETFYENRMQTPLRKELFESGLSVLGDLIKRSIRKDQNNKETSQ